MDLLNLRIISENLQQEAWDPEKTVRQVTRLTSRTAYNFAVTLLFFL